MKDIPQCTVMVEKPTNDNTSNTFNSFVPPLEREWLDMRPWKKILVFPLTFMNKNRVDIKVEQTFFISTYIIHDKDLTL
jgi:hypothetical protein